MKKLIALVLSLMLVAAIPTFAFAEGFGDNSAGALDDLNNEFVVVSTNLENATGKMATPDNTSDKTYFGLYDSDDAAHGRVYMIESATWAAVTNGNTGVTYTYGDKTQTLFNESLEANSYYIYSYDYKSFPTDSSSLNQGGYFSFAPQVDTFSNGEGDWKDYVPASVNKWSRRTNAFYSGDVTGFSAKINTEKSYTVSYIDNFYLVKAAKIELNAKNDVELDTNGTGVMYSDKLGAYVAPMGEPVTLKITTASGEKIAKVMHGNTEVTPTNGEYKIDKLTDNVTVDFSFSKQDFEENDEVKVDGEYIFVGLGDRFASFTKSLGIPRENSLFFDAAGAEITSSVAVISAGSTIKIKYGDDIVAEYLTKFLGDINEDNAISVTDIVTLSEKVLAGEASAAGDLDKNDKNTVSDLVLLRKEVLNPKNLNSAPEKFKVLAIGNSFSIDAMEHLYKVAKAYGYEEDEIILGNLYIGGCSLQTHWNNASSNAPAYSYYKNTENKWVSAAEQTLLYGLQDEDWDYISIQQVSQNSGMTSTFEPYLKNLIDYVNENKTNPAAQLMWHSTWAYQQDSTHSGFKNYDSNQETMYNAILDAGEYVFAEYPEISILLPSGTAIQNMRTVLGDYLTRDGYHMNNNYGRLTAGLVWFKAITGAELEDLATDADLLSICASGAEELSANGVTVSSDELLSYCIAAADAAIEKPMGITDISTES